MSKDLPSRPEPVLEPWRIVIVASEYNREFVEGLVEFAKSELADIAPRSLVQIYRVPGSFEIPLAVKRALRKLPVDAVLAFGVIFDGETMHADLIATASTQALLDLSLQHEIPILHEIIVVKTEEQARLRCLEPDLNRGTEAARAAVRILTALNTM